MRRIVLLVLVLAISAVFGSATVADAIPPAPTITGLSPSVGPVGTTVVITGTNLETTQEVLFGNTQVAGSFTSTTISVTVPAGVSGTVSVTVHTAGGMAVSPTDFTVGAPPTPTPTPTPTPAPAATPAPPTVDTTPAGTNAAPGTTNVPVARLASVKSTLKVSAKGSTTVSIACAGPGTCAGTASLTLITVKTSHAKTSSQATTTTKPIASASYAVHVGKTQQVTLKLSSAAKKDLKKLGKLISTLALTPKGGGSAAVEKTVTLKDA
jgi:hypothetical protein